MISPAAVILISYLKNTYFQGFHAGDIELNAVCSSALLIVRLNRNDARQIVGTPGDVAHRTTQVMSRQGNEPESQIVPKRPRQEDRLIQHSRSTSIPRSIVSSVYGFDMFPRFIGWGSSLECANGRDRFVDRLLKVTRKSFPNPDSLS